MPVAVCASSATACDRSEGPDSLFSARLILQLMEPGAVCHPGAAASAELPFTVTHGPVPPVPTLRSLIADGKQWEAGNDSTTGGSCEGHVLWALTQEETPSSCLNPCGVGVC